MRIEYVVVTFLLYILGSLTACEPAADDKNLARIQISEMPDSLRIVALAPHLAELVSAAGAGDFLVGVSNYSDYPKEITSLFLTTTQPTDGFDPVNPIPFFAKLIARFIK